MNFEFSEWLVNGLVHCPKCKKTKQIPYAFRRPTICQICKVNYVNQCAICKKKFTKFKTLRLHLQSKCNGKQLSMKKETEAYISEHSSTNWNDESFQQIKVEINGSEVGSNVDIVHTTVEPNVGKYSCSLCKKLFTNKYRKNSHEKNCKQLNCERCDFEATTSEHLRDHMRSAHTIIDPADYFLCNKCTKPFTDKFVKNKHEKYCGLELNLKCPKENCYYFTNRIERLQAHIQTTHISLLPQF